MLAHCRAAKGLEYIIEMLFYEVVLKDHIIKYASKIMCIAKVNTFITSKTQSLSVASLNFILI